MPMTLTELEAAIDEFNLKAFNLKGMRDLLVANATEAGLNKRAIGKRLASVKVIMPESQ